MRPNAFLWLLLAATIKSQSIWDFLPECAQECPEEGVAAATNCQSTDYKCLCESSEFHLVTACCVRANCDSTEDAEVLADSQALCEEYGVAVTDLPASACTSTWGVSSTVASATGSATTATTTTTSTSSAADTDTTAATATEAVTVEAFTITDIITDYNGPVTTEIFTYFVTIPVLTADAASSTSTGSSSSDSGSSSSGNSNNDGSSSSGSDSSSSTNNKKASSGLSEGAKIGIGVGAGVGGLIIIGAIVGLIVYFCCVKKRRNARSSTAETATAAATTSYTPVSLVPDPQDEKVNAAAIATVYNGNKPEMDAQQLQQRRSVSPMNEALQQQHQQHNPAAVPSSALPAAYAGPVSPTTASSNPSLLTTPGANELHSDQTYYYRSPDGGAQELSGLSSYQYHPGVVTQAEMSAEGQEYVTRYELHGENGMRGT